MCLEHIWDIVSNISGFITIFAIISAPKIEADHVGLWASQVTQMVKNLPQYWRPGSKRSPGKGNGYPLQYCFFFFFWLEANYFIIMWWFFPYFNTNQPWVYMCPPILNSPSTPPPHSIPLGCPKALALSALLNASALNLYCLENSTDREAWLSTVQGVSKNQIQLNN